MAATSAPTRSVLPIVVPGQLTLRTIRGKNGPFTVGRLFSSYQVAPSLQLWIITEWDRSVTTLLLPSEY